MARICIMYEPDCAPEAGELHRLLNGRHHEIVLDARDHYWVADAMAASLQTLSARFEFGLVLIGNERAAGWYVPEIDVTNRITDNGNLVAVIRRGFVLSEKLEQYKHTLHVEDITPVLIDELIEAVIAKP